MVPKAHRAGIIESKSNHNAQELVLLALCMPEGLDRGEGLPLSITFLIF